MSDILRAGLIGLGMMGRHHARILAALDGVEFVVAADAFGDRFGALRGAALVDDVEPLLEHDLDICVVAVPTEDHERLGLALADAGVHTLIEKPIARDTSAAARLVQAFAERKLLGAVGHVERFNPSLQSLRARLESGELGELYQIATRRQGPFPGRVRDVGVTTDLASHDFDLTAWIAGSPYVSVSALTAHKAGREHEDMVTALGTLGSGLATNHVVNWLTPFKERVTIVTGERGCFVADTGQMDLTFYENGEIANEWEAISRFRGVSEGNMTRFAISKPEPLLTELTNFRDAVLGISRDIVTLEEGMQTLQVVEAALQSAKAGGQQVRVGG